MVKNYYKVLSIPSTATEAEVHEGFKRAILKWHPKKTKFPLEQANKEFLEACEAYDVLSSSTYRSVYDAYGYETLSNGIKDGDHTVFPAYKFSSTPAAVYRRFMLQANPFVGIISNVGLACIGSVSGYSATGQNWQIDLLPADVHVSVACSLEDLFFGCSKKVKYAKTVAKATGEENTENVKRH
jgi:DnaJ homolog subfamily B member 13